MLVERPDRALHAGVWDTEVVAAERAVGIDVDHLFGDWPERRHEMIGRLDDDEFALRRLDVEVAEQFQAKRLGAVGDEHDLDAAGLDCGAVAEPDLGWAEALPCVAFERSDRYGGVDRLAGGGADFSAEAQREAGALAGIETKPHRDGVPDRADRGALRVALDQPAQDGGVVGGRAAVAACGATYRFFENLRTITAYIVFQDWSHLLQAIAAADLRPP